MSYSNSRERIEALEALSRAYNNVVSAAERKNKCAENLLGAIEGEVNRVKDGQKKDVDYLR